MFDQKFLLTLWEKVFTWARPYLGEALQAKLAPPAPPTAAGPMAEDDAILNDILPPFEERGRLLDFTA